MEAWIGQLRCNSNQTSQCSFSFTHSRTKQLRLYNCVYYLFAMHILLADANENCRFQTALVVPLIFWRIHPPHIAK